MKHLTDIEWNTLQTISSKAKMDWFYLQQNAEGEDIVVDLENNKTLPLTKAILQLDEGLTSLDDYGLTEEMKTCYIALLYKANMDTEKPLNRLYTLLYNTICFLEEQYGCCILDCKLKNELGISENEYNFIMSHNYVV